ncbi:MAG: hypothetical protein ACYCS9_00315 [Candidatus Dormibacteria bacterium]
MGIGAGPAEPDAVGLLLELSARETTGADAISRLAAGTGRLATILDAKGIPASDRHTRTLDLDPWHGRLGG